MIPILFDGSIGHHTLPNARLIMHAARELGYTVTIGNEISFGLYNVICDRAQECVAKLDESLWGLWE